MELAFQTAGSSDFQGNLVSPLGPHRFLCVWLGSASLACFHPHLVLGVSGLWVDEVAGQPFPHSRRDTSSALCLRAAGGKERTQAPPVLRGNAPELEDVKTQIKPLRTVHTLGTQARLLLRRSNGWVSITADSFGIGIGKRQVGLIFCKGI